MKKPLLARSSLGAEDIGGLGSFDGHWLQQPLNNSHNNEKRTGSEHILFRLQKKHRNTNNPGVMSHLVASFNRKRTGMVVQVLVRLVNS